MATRYKGLMQVCMNGQTLDLPTLNDTAVVFQCSQQVRILNVYALVTEEILDDTNVAIVDIGTASDPDAFVDGMEAEFVDGSAVDSILSCTAAHIVDRDIPANTKVIAKVVEAATDSVGVTGQVDFIMEVSPQV